VKPFLLVQLSDPHIGANWNGDDPRAALEAAVASVRGLPDAPDAVLVSGDLAENAADGEYELIRELLAPLDAPLYVVPGNHDDPERLRAHFAATADDVVDLGPLRLLLLDSTIEGQDTGELTSGQLAWLHNTLAADRSKPAVLALHHPPLVTGLPSADQMGIGEQSRHALARVVERHPQLKRIVAGHVHRAIVGELGGCSVITAPSTFAQLKLDFRSPEIQVVPEPPGFAVHAFVDGELLSHIQPVT
jgi:3',5'-cyclic AMP phosphodiesterase CpdA